MQCGEGACGAPADNGNGTNFTPPFPAYVSGHATFGGATFKLLEDFYHTDVIPGGITIISDEFNTITVDQNGHPRPLLPRTYNYFSQMAGENAQSRIYLGIHWHFDAVEGIRSGDGIGDYVFTHALQPLHGRQPQALPSMDPEAQIALAVQLEDVAADGGLHENGSGLTGASFALSSGGATLASAALGTAGTGMANRAGVAVPASVGSLGATPSGSESPSQTLGTQPAETNAQDQISERIHKHFQLPMQQTNDLSDAMGWDFATGQWLDQPEAAS